MPRKKKDYGEIKNYQVVNGGIWIPKEECQRLSELLKSCMMILPQSHQYVA